MAGVVGLVVVALVVAIVLVKVLGNSSASASGSANLAPPDVVAAVTGLPMATLDQIGLGTTTERQQLLVSAPIKVSGQSALTSGGKPQVVYVGAEYCPFCAAERWAMVAALGKFGTFHNLRATHSSTTDVYPNTQTFSFYHSSYTSPYLVFSPTELETPTYQTLQKPTALVDHLVSVLDGPPYTGPASSTNTGGSIPFVDFANRYIISGASYSPQVLQGLTMADIAGSLSDPSLPTAKAIGIATNQIIGALCLITGHHPANVCSSPAATQAMALLSAQKAVGK